MSRPTITLTTDFGTSDAYVGAMKGVILSLCEDATIVDVSHEIERHNISEASYVLASASTYYPTSAVHVAVVDPGVGSSRRPLILQTARGTFVSPDNGTLTHILNEFGACLTDSESDMSSQMVEAPEGCRAFHLDKPGYWLPNVTRTFHGRDVFAPTAAHLANGVPASDLGSPIDTMVCLTTPSFSTTENAVYGIVVHIDAYGNIITNIPPEAVPDNPEIHISGRVVRGLSQSYADATGELLAIIGSRNTLEVAVGEGDARTLLNTSVGDRVDVEWCDTNPKPCQG
ncbi:MAG: SAM-dependent chlorinase/fluorinase [Dehalococcoidia bacterium]|nr:SAM-dependent chlorinase/fluorinase [Dehalococcoidia bacterium]